MDALALFAVIWVVGKIFGSLSKKKTREGQGQSQGQRMRQAVEEQKRRREAYEAEQREKARLRINDDDDMPPYRRTADAAAPPYRHDSADGRPAHRTVQRNMQRPRTLTQAPRQLYTPTAPTPLPHHIDEIEETRCAEAVRAKRLSAPVPAPPMQSVTAKDYPQAKRGGVPLQGNALVQGIIMAEILGPPRSKKRLIK